MNIKTLLKQVQLNELIESLESNREVFLGTDPELDFWLTEGFFDDAPETVVEAIFEELTVDEKYKADRLKGSGHSHYMNSFMEHSPEAKAEFESQRSKEGQGRIRFPVTLDASTATPNQEVKQFLGRVGYTTNIEHYRKGLASKTVTVGDPERGIPMQEKTVHRKIGAVLDELRADDRIKKAYMSDPSRASSTKGNDFDVVISHHPHDVYGMSTGRGWVSCASMRKGESTSDMAARHMPEEINNQTHVAYLVPRGGDVDTQAIARIALKRHDSVSSNHATLVPETTVYSGGAPVGFKEEVHKLTNRLFPARSGEIYKKNDQVYDDAYKPWHIPAGAVSSDSMDKAWTSTKANDTARHALIDHVQPNTKYKSTNLNKISKALGNLHAKMETGDFIESANALHEYQGSMTPDQFKHGQHRDNTKYHEHLKKIGEMADMNNPEHVSFIKGAYKTAWLRGSDFDVATYAHRRFVGAPVHTVQDMVNNVRYHTEFAGKDAKFNYADKAQIPENHKIGGHAFRKIAHELDKNGLLNHHTATHAFLSLPQNSRRGNLYDNIVGLANHPEIHGADNLIDHTISELRQSDHQKRATVFYHSRPETTRVLASKMGVDAKEVIKPFRQKFKDDENHLNELKKKAAQKMTVQP